MRFVALFLLIASANPVSAAVDCENFAAYSCTDGKNTDVSGRVLSDTEAGKKMEEYRAKLSPPFQEKWKAILRDPKNAKLLNDTLETFAIRDCKESCAEKAAQKLLELNFKQSLKGHINDKEKDKFPKIKSLDSVLNSDHFKKVGQDLREQIKKEVVAPQEQLDNVEKVFKDVKALLKERIESFNISSDHKEIMIKKLEQIGFGGTDCVESKKASSEDALSSLFVPNAYLDPISRKFRMCSSMLLRSTSKFAFTATIAHELSHSFDPCLISSDTGLRKGFEYKVSKSAFEMQDQFPLGPVLKCMRGENSVAAKRMKNIGGDDLQQDDPREEGRGAPKRSSKGVDVMGVIKAAIPSSNSPFCQADQIGESFCDWMAAEIMPDYVGRHYQMSQEQTRDAYANVMRDLCLSDRKQGHNHGDDVHPEAETRINKILMANPRARAQIGCPALSTQTPYCSASGTSVMNETNSKKQKVMK